MRKDRDEDADADDDGRGKVFCYLLKAVLSDVTTLNDKKTFTIEVDGVKKESKGHTT